MQEISFYSGILYQSDNIDDEWFSIIKRLKNYGFNSTGSKSGDYALLRKIEIRQIEQNNIVSNLLTISSSEQQKIQDDKQKVKGEYNNNTDLNLFEAANLLGTQILLTVKMNNNEQKEKYKYT